MGAEGTKGGAVNRPASRHEIEKLPRETCVRCGLNAARPIVDDGLCSNLYACGHRQVANALAEKRAKELKNG